MSTRKSFFDLFAIDIEGKSFKMSELKGKKILIVNTASECGFTNQFSALEEIYQHFGPDKFVVIGFPSNDFGGQDPGSNMEIAEFCERSYGVSFPMMSKSVIRKSEDQHPVFQWLTRKDMNGVADIEVTWNFQKFAINEEGVLIRSFHPETEPLDYKIIDWIQNPTLF